MKLLEKLLAKDDLFIGVTIIYGVLVLLCILLGVYGGFLGHFGKQSRNVLFKKSGIYLSVGIGLGLLAMSNLDGFWQWFNTYLDQRPANQSRFTSFRYIVWLFPLAIFYLLSFIVIYVGPFYCLFYGKMTAIAGVIPKSWFPVISKIAYYPLFVAFALIMFSPLIISFLTFFIDNTSVRIRQLFFLAS